MIGEHGETLAMVAQLGAAGLIGWLWISERRFAVVREKQLGEAHERLAGQREHLDQLLRVVEGNTRALTALESSQRTLAGAIERLERAERRGRRPDAA